VTGTDGGRTVRARGVVLVLAGALLTLASYRLFDWYDVPGQAADSTRSVTFSALGTSADQLTDAAFATAYFDWLAWVLLIALILIGVAANVRSGLTDPLRVAGFIVGLGGAASTYFALTTYFDSAGSAHNVFDNSSWGLWAALAGFLLGGVGAALGPGRAAR
jgi:hypothetical protein